MAKISQQNPITITKNDLPLSCPRPGDEIWNKHPKIYLPIEKAKDQTITCPYCGALYQLVDKPASSHPE